ncbi:MAG: hypothetical protein U5Q03_13575 [Bacteroidota bacterium]|nr:hypothetical protein [Bacteroidota bacterium]
MALLPMKGHSERVPNKNLKLFHNKPLYHHILESLIRSNILYRSAINTDSREIKEDVKKNFDKNRVILIDRPETIRGDFVLMRK